MVGLFPLWCASTLKLYLQENSEVSYVFPDIFIYSSVVSVTFASYSVDLQLKIILKCLVTKQSITIKSHNQEMKLFLPLFPIPYSLFPIPYSLFPIPYSLFSRHKQRRGE
jgi:hypothetical protein